MQDKTPAARANGGDSEATAGAAVSREIANLLADAEDLIKATTSLTGEDLVRMRAQLAKRVAAAKESIEEVGDAVAGGARKTGTTTNTYVHEQPWKAIGATAATAFVLGLLVARRR